ncbi:MAG TPA: sarcosine oxidase subunit gamma family protein [Alphaproteobacteria bacterium]|nr:sarcosine oxidase subunit gamma family protein [Alphaproteobacteria bacterium]
MLEPLAAMRSPLAEMAARLAVASIPGQVTLTALPIAAQLDLRGDPRNAAFLASAEAALGTALPLEPNRVATAEDLAALWLSPDEWLIVIPFAHFRATEAALSKALAGQHAAVTDVSANRAILALEGPRAPEVLMKGCSLDLHPRQFKAGHCAQTNLARAQIILHQVDAGPRFHLYVRPSFAQYLADWLVDAMVEYRAAD